MASTTEAGASEATLRAALEARLDSMSDSRLDSVYGANPLPLWTDGGGGLTPPAEQALERLAAAEKEGLDPDRYEISRLRRLERAEESTASGMAELETTLTLGLIDLERDLLHGAVATSGFDPGWQMPHADSLSASGWATAEEMLAAIRSARPEARQYRRLVELRHRLTEVAGKDGWPTVPSAGATLALGDSSPAVARARARLAGSVDPEERRLAAGAEAHPARMDSALVESLSRFQQRHDLREDGVLGPGTVEVMNVTPEARIAEVDLALERWRWLPRELGSRAVVVNTPGLRLHVLEDGRSTLSMKVVIGQPDWATTLFSDTLTRIVVNPYWNVPESIFEEETLPRLVEDPSYLEEMGFEVVDPSSGEVVDADEIEWEEVDAEAFPYRVRQKPGERNALGEVKFLFPNAHAIYLHDTPAEHLFDERVRTFSHGCIRVERPAELARYVLRHATDVDPGRYPELVDSGERHAVALDDPIPVHVIYQTVWVDAEGVPTFSPDLYDRNRRPLRMLESATPSSTRASR